MPHGPTHGFSPEQVEEFQEVFTQFDTDGSGAISEEELGVVLSQFGQAPTADELSAMIMEVDEDNNGEVDFDEFLDMMACYAAKATNMDQLNAPDAPAVIAVLSQRVMETKNSVLARVEACLQDEVGVNAARAIRTDSGKDFFQQELQKGVVYILRELSSSFDELNLSMNRVLELKDKKQADGVVATRARSFVEAANAVVDSKRAAKAQMAALQRKELDKQSSMGAASRNQQAEASAKQAHTENKFKQEEFERKKREREIEKLEQVGRQSGFLFENRPACLFLPEAALAGPESCSSGRPHS
jgi:hypothetical protein